jgi:sugar lactone lactonase YvrE
LSIHVRRLVLAAVAASLAACSSAGTGVTPPAFSPMALHAAAVPASGDLYVIDPAHDVVNIFDGKSDPSAQITDAKTPRNLAFDPHDALAVANDRTAQRPAIVNLYKPFALTAYQLVPLANNRPNAVAFDSKGLLYVADGMQFEVYRPGRTAPIRTVKMTESGKSLAFDAENDLLVTMSDQVVYFKAGGTRPNRIINGIAPGNAIFNSFDAIIIPDTPNSRVAVYKKGSPNKPSYITKDVSKPVWVAIDGTDTLFVANGDKNNVTVYDQKFKLLRTIKAGIKGVSKMIVTPNGYLWVCNAGNVTGYKPKSTALDQTLNTHCKDLAVAP